MTILRPVRLTASRHTTSLLFERYAKGGDNPKLKDWAGKTLPALQHHLEMAQALKSKATTSASPGVVRLFCVAASVEVACPGI